MTQKQLINEAFKHFSEQYRSTKDELHRIQPTPLGTVPRSERSEKALWKKMRALPPEQFNAMMNEAAKKAGHKNDEKPPCAMCKFVIDHVGDE